MVVTHCDATRRLIAVVNRALAIGVMWLSVLVNLLRKGFEQELFEK